MILNRIVFAYRVCVLSVLIGLGSVSEASATAWTMPRGRVSAKLSLLGSRSRAIYNAIGQKSPLPFDGRSQLAGIIFDVAYGITDRFTVATSIPVLTYRLTNQTVLGRGGISETGLGDISVTTKLNIVNDPATAAISIATKMPTAATTDPSRLPVGEGQMDMELVSSVGRRWGDNRGYGNVELGYRIRTRDGTRDFKPGNEWLSRVEGGYAPWERLGLTTTFYAFHGGPLETTGLRLETGRRRLLMVSPRVNYRLGRAWWTDLSVDFPLAGRNYYAGKRVILGFSYSTVQTSGMILNIPTVNGGGCCSIR